jgi:hypothetical protein
MCRCVHERGGLARAARNYIDIIDGFVGQLVWCYADNTLKHVD